MRLLIAARNRTVAVEDDRIVPTTGTFDTVLEMPDADVRPGLINAHDHLHRNHYGRLGGRRYANAYQWAADIQHRYRRRIRAQQRRPRRDALLTGAWKNLFAGVTSVVHHDPWEPEFERDFPVRVVRLPTADSLGMTPGLEGLDDATTGKPFSLHVAEGTDAIAEGEIEQLAAKGLLNASLIAVHGVAISGRGIARFRQSGAALVWCPTSNLFLFGATAPAELLGSEVDVLLGSDSRLTGEGDLLDEMRIASALGALDAKRLADSVGDVAARRLGIAAPSLAVGARADLILIRKPPGEASAEDVQLVLVGGAPRVARPDLGGPFERKGFVGTAMTVGPVVRWISTQSSKSRQGRTHR